MTDVLEIFAPYGPGSLFGALLVLVVLYFGKQFLEEFKAQNERKANIDLKREERKQDEVNERAQRDRERSQMEGRIAAQMERSNALMEAMKALMESVVTSTSAARRPGEQPGAQPGHGGEGRPHRRPRRPALQGIGSIERNPK